MRDIYDVIIIGAGPAGSMAAQRLAQDNWRVILVEKSSCPGKDNVCGGLMSRSVVEELGLYPQAIEKVMSKEVHIMPWGRVNNTTQQVTIQRKVLDRMMAEKAMEAGAELITNTRALQISVTGPGNVHIIARRSNPWLNIKLNGKAVIFADGPHTLARSIGLGYQPNEIGTAFALAYELDWPNNPMEHYEIYYGKGIAEWGYGWIFPYKDTLNVGLGCLEGELRRSRKLKADLMNFIKHHPAASKVLKDKGIVSERGAFIPMNPAKHIALTSSMVVGDAAGMVFPLLASGLDNAVAAGKLAGQVMSQALAKGDLSSHAMQKYQNLWMEGKRHKVINFQYRLVQLAHIFIRWDPYLPPKVNQLALMGGFLSWPDKFRALLYPLLGTPTPRTELPGRYTLNTGNSLYKKILKLVLRR